MYSSLGNRIAVLQIDTNELRLIVIKKRLERFQIVDIAEVTANHNNRDAMLRDLVHKYSIDNLAIAIILPYSSFNCNVVDVPDGLEPEEIPEWSENWMHSRIPNLAEFYWHNLEIKSDAINSVLFFWISRQFCDECLQVFLSLSLKPVYLGCGLECAGLAFFENDALFSQEQCISVSFKNERLEFSYLRGCINNIMHISAAPIHEIVNDIAVGQHKLSGDFVPLFGIGLNCLTNISPAVNMLSKNLQIEITDSLIGNRLKASCFKSIALLAATACLAFIGNVLIVQKSSPFIYHYQQKRQSLESVKSIVATLTERNLAIYHLFMDHQDTAIYLEIIGQALPDGVWLNQINITPERGISISGIASNSQAVTVFLRVLEQSQQFSSVRLDQLQSQEIKQSENTMIATTSKFSMIFTIILEVNKKC